MDAETDTETDADARAVEHRLGGVAADLAGVKALAPPEEDGRLVVDTLEVEGGQVVTLAIRSSLVSGRLLLDADRAHALADRLATAAAETSE